MDLHSLLIECAHQEGFPLAGALDLDLALASPEFQQQISHYDQWIEAGYSGAMEYLVRGRDRRANPRILFPEAESILCVAIPYPRTPAGAKAQNQGPRYARYLQGPDYHADISEKLEKAMKAAQSKWTNPDENRSLQWKVCVDTSAVLERTWAALAGLGWIGKNTLLIHPKLGSYLFLAEVLINQKTGRGPTPLPSYCGHCTRCLDSCPTQAFEAPRMLNSKQCISYLTLEKRGELPIGEKNKKAIGPWIAGCDICQEVCPFNIKPSREESQDLQSLDNVTLLSSWSALLSESVDDYKKRVKNSAMKRIKPAQFSRNLAITLTNHLLDSKIKEDLTPLAPLILRRFEIETDEVARLEWKKCLESFDAQVMHYS
jgi:epoxyqueuosine reductase